MQTLILHILEQKCKTFAPAKMTSYVVDISKGKDVLAKIFLKNVHLAAKGKQTKKPKVTRILICLVFLKLLKIAGASFLWQFLCKKAYLDKCSHKATVKCLLLWLNLNISC